MNQIFLRSASFDEIVINKKEALRYLGYKSAQPVNVNGLFDVAESEIKKAAILKACYSKTDITVENEEIDFGFCKIKSHDLSKNLNGCKEAYIFAATLGSGVDRLIMKYEKFEPSKAVLIDALSSATIEGLCNLVNQELASGLKTKPRYSPGYGDVPLTYQKDFLAFLDAGRKLGITLTDTFFMSPTKSVTAIIGIETEEE